MKNLKIHLIIGAYDLALGYGYVLVWLLGHALNRVFQKLLNRRVAI